jgi:hypothetical protein
MGLSWISSRGDTVVVKFLESIEDTGKVLKHTVMGVERAFP